MSPIVQERKTSEEGREGVRHYYWCPGCDALHGIAINPHKQANCAGWDFTGTMECPTYAPSQKTTRGVQVMFEGRMQDFVCHTFIKAGKIEFLNDCTHNLKGQTVPLPPLPDWFVNEKDDV